MTLAVADPGNDIFEARACSYPFAALFLFTIVLYARPAEFYPSAADQIRWH